MSTDFTCTTYGKCIIMGEHAVLRGVPALVFPLKSRSLTLSYQALKQDLILDLVGDHGKDLQLLVWGVLERACNLKKISLHDLKGVLHLGSSIPVGAGMGASGALCVALTKWLGHLGIVHEKEYYEFARSLENLFHGESSGVDIAIALSGQGLKFVRDGEKTTLKLAWHPKWFISYTGKRGITLDAVNQVKEFIAKNPDRGEYLDKKMFQAVELAEKSLLQRNIDSFENLKKSFELAATCFEEWSLNDAAVKNHFQWLRNHGAAAMKPTGSGGGGYVLSLWENSPPSEALRDLIPF